MSLADIAILVRQARLKKRMFREVQVMDWFVQLTFALEYMHDRKLSHGDITVNADFYLQNTTHFPQNRFFFWSKLSITVILCQPRNIFVSRRYRMIKLGAPDVHGRREDVYLRLDLVYNLEKPMLVAWPSFCIVLLE